MVVFLLKFIAMKEFVITVEENSEPALLTFRVNRPLVKTHYTYTNIDAAQDSPLAQQLFHLPFIKSVQLLPDAIVLERFSIVEWPDVQDEVAQQLVEYLNSGGVVVHELANTLHAITMYAEVTPNPNVMKFVANKRIVPGLFEFKSIQEAKDTGLAEALFNQGQITQVFMDENYVSVTKTEAADWAELAMDLRTFIRDYIIAGKPVIADGLGPSTLESVQTQTQLESLDGTSKAIINILDEYVKPAVASDGGNILFQSYEPESKTVNVILQGACSGCPSSTYTLKNGIEQMLKNMLGDKVEEVVAING